MRESGWCVPTVVLLAGLALALRSVGLTALFGADNLGHGGGLFSVIARNYLRYGFAATGLVPVVTAEGPPSPPAYYAHHPPLVPLLVSGSFALFGEREWAARLVPLVASMIALGLLVHLAARTYGGRVAVFTLAIATTLPLDAHLASHVDVQGSVLLAFVLATFACVAHRRYLAAGVVLTLGAATDWPALYAPVLLAVAPWPFEHPRRRLAVAGLLAYAAVLFVALAVWLMTPSAVVELLRERALSFHSDTGEPFDFAAWFRLVVGTYLWELCTPAVLVTVLVWLALRLPALIRRPHPDRLALLLVLFGAMHLIVGFQGAFQHEFWATYLRAGVPLVCALLVERVAVTARPGVVRWACVGALLAVLMVPGLVEIFRLHAAPLSRRMTDADYSPHDLAMAVRACTPRGAAAITSDYDGEAATFFYADRPLAIAVVTPALLDAQLEEPRYAVPGGSSPDYALPSVTPTCFVLPTRHATWFPELTRQLRERFRSRVDGPFETFVLAPPS